MPTYVRAISLENDELFPKCGTREIAGNWYNLNKECAGENFSLVYAVAVRVGQPYDVGADSFNKSRFNHSLTITVPNYQPVQSMILNMMNEQKTIHTLTLNTVQIRPGASKQTLIGQYSAENGIVVDYVCDPTSNGMGRITATMVFEKLNHNNLITHTSGYLKTTA